MPCYPSLFARIGRKDFRGASFPKGRDGPSVVLGLSRGSRLRPPSRSSKINSIHKSALLFLNFGLAESFGF